MCEFRGLGEHLSMSGLHTSSQITGSTTKGQRWRRLVSAAVFAASVAIGLG